MGYESSFRKIGCRVSVENGSDIKKGYAVIYPLRYSHDIWGGNETKSEGRTEINRYLMFCGRELLVGTGYGSVISDGKNRYMLVWKDEYSCRLGGYIKAVLRKMTEEE